MISFRENFIITLMSRLNLIQRKCSNHSDKWSHQAISNSGFFKAESKSYTVYLDTQGKKLIAKLESNNKALRTRLAKLESNINKK